MPHTKQESPRKPDASRIAIIKAVKGPLGFYVLVALLMEAVIGTFARLFSDSERTVLIWCMVVLPFTLVAIVTLLAVIRPEALQGRRPAPPAPPLAEAALQQGGPQAMLQLVRAQADAKLLAVDAEIEAEDRQRRAERRRRTEDLAEQRNLEQIAARMQPWLAAGSANDTTVDEDWLTNWMKNARFISNEQMQTLWARVLAGEINQPGTFSRRTINAIAGLDRRDLEMFTKLCCFCWKMGGDDVPLIFANTMETVEKIYTIHNLDYEIFRHLDAIGLITLMSPGSSFLRYVDGPIEISYFGERFMLDSVGVGGRISVGRVMLTATGAELAPISGAEAIPDFRDFILSRWQNVLRPVSTS